MLDLLIKSAVRRKIVALFALNPDEELYSASVAGEIEESAFTTGLELKSLSDGGLLKRREEGRRVYYRWNEAHPIASEITLLMKKLGEKGDAEVRRLPDLKRRRKIQENLDGVVAGLKKYYDPEKIIVFGSAATGRVGPYSDIDLVVIKKTALPYFERIKQIVGLVEYDVGVDFIVYTPREFERAVKERRFVRQEIVKKGRVLYDKAA